MNMKQTLTFNNLLATPHLLQDSHIQGSDRLFGEI